MDYSTVREKINRALRLEKEDVVVVMKGLLKGEHGSRC